MKEKKCVKKKLWCAHNEIFAAAISRLKFPFLTVICRWFIFLFLIFPSFAFRIVASRVFHSLPSFSFPDCLSLGHTSCSLAYCVALYAAVGFSLPLSFSPFLPFILLNAPWHYFGVVLPTWQSPGATLRADTREHVPTDTSTCGCSLQNVLQWFVLSPWAEFVVHGTWYPFARVVLF